MAFAEVEDLMCYCADILGQASPSIQRHLCHVLWRTFIGPAVFWPLLSPTHAPPRCDVRFALYPSRFLSRARSLSSGSWERLKKSKRDFDFS